MRITPLRVALVGLLCAVLFQCFVVQGFGGNWTLPFHAGDLYPPPPELRGKVYQVPNSYGFDGQFYHYIARDFWDARGTSQYIDDPRLRWQRALLPGMASILSFGHPDFAAPAYIGIVWLLCAIGLWLLARIFECFGYPAVFGLGFFAIPAVLVSLDRMMTDIALVVAILAVVYGSLRQIPWLVYGALALAPLARETGVALIAGWVLFHLWQRAWRPALLGCLTALPFLAWSVWVSQRYPGDPTHWLGAPFSGILRRLLQPAIYETPVLGFKLAAATDYLGAWGIAAAFVLVIGLFLRGDRSLLIFVALIYTLGIAVFTKEDMWGEAYSYTRTGGPAAVLLALIGMEQRRWWLVAPLLLALPRIALQYGAVAWVALRGWL